jgi:hypothetical protein
MLISGQYEKVLSGNGIRERDSFFNSLLVWILPTDEVDFLVARIPYSWHKDSVFVKGGEDVDNNRTDGSGFHFRIFSWLSGKKKNPVRRGS